MSDLLNVSLSVQFVSSYKMVYITECKQLRKHPEPQTQHQNQDQLLNRIASVHYPTNSQYHVLASFRTTFGEIDHCVVLLQ